MAVRRELSLGGEALERLALPDRLVSVEVGAHAGGEDEEAAVYPAGDGLADVDIGRLLTHHREHGTLATVTAVQPPGRFGALVLDDGRVTGFAEKPQGDGGWINGGFFVLSPGVFGYIDGDDTSWEAGPMPALADQGQLRSYKHDGFWYAMDTVRDRNHLQELWATGEAPWKVWD